MRFSTLALPLLLLTPSLLACSDDDGGSAGTWSVVENAPESGGFSTTTLWAFADDNVWLGGQSCWQYDGSTWTERPVMIGGEKLTFVREFWAFGPNDLWAIVDDRIVNWDGTTWTEVPNTTTSIPFNALSVIWGSAPDNMWVANEDNSRVYHWDGTTWTLEVLQFVFANALWGSSASDIWLTGATDVYRYDGTAWAEYESPARNEPRGAGDLWGFGPNEIWAADGDILRFDGTEWNEEELERGYHHLWGSSSSDIFAVGNYQSIAHYNGSEWEEETGVIERQQNFLMVHGSSPTNVWATAVDFDTGVFLMRRDR